MAKKNKKGAKNTLGSKSKKQHSGHSAGGVNHIVFTGLYGIAGFCLCYFVQPVLNFGIQDANSFFLAFLCGGLAVAGNTGFFQKSMSRIVPFALIFVMTHIVVNTALTYGWIDQQLIWKVLGNQLTIPLAILWFFILKATATFQDTDQSISWFSPGKIFNNIPLMIALGVVILTAGFIIFYRLGYYDIWEDEGLVINAAKGVYEQGLSYFKEGYSRAWLHTLICAGSFSIFGISEWAGRLPSAIFGLIFILTGYYVFARWYGLAWLAILVPFICLMNDHFLLLFRYMRMYALLIPLFLLGIFLLHKTIWWYAVQAKQQLERISKSRQIFNIGLSLLVILLLGHLHKLSMILLPVFSLWIVAIALTYRSRNQVRLLKSLVVLAILLFVLTFVVEIHELRMFRQVYTRIMQSGITQMDYYQYMFDNGLPGNSTIMILLGGIGLFFSAINHRTKWVLGLSYLFIFITLILMAYFITNRGRDYRYVAHIVPFVVGSMSFVLYNMTSTFRYKIFPAVMAGMLAISAIQLYVNKDKLYTSHPWSPRYTVAYETLKARFKPGDALIAAGIKTFYLKPDGLAHDRYKVLPKNKEYSLEELKQDVAQYGHGYITWEWHKSHYLRREVIEYIYATYKPILAQSRNALGVELFYFDPSMR